MESDNIEDAKKRMEKEFEIISVMEARTVVNGVLKAKEIDNRGFKNGSYVGEAGESLRVLLKAGEEKGDEYLNNVSEAQILASMDKNIATRADAKRKEMESNRFESNKEDKDEVDR